ncbi:MAG: hypothetical protein IT233_02560 [Bacteroidia bacterium]|nr:hypothetical protein [Bacteroidia bacterium]
MKLPFLYLVLLLPLLAQTQALPSSEENIPFLVTFGSAAEKNWGDDDFTQVVFFSVPVGRKDPVYVRIFDADVGGKHDENRSGFNTRTKFSMYGGKGAHSDPDAKKVNPAGNYKAGVLLNSKSFGMDATADNTWYTFGPFNPTEGELQPEYGGYVFKLIVEGAEGDDGNLYKLYFSSKEKDNAPVEGGNGFTYEYCFRTNEQPNTVCHLYPFVNPAVISVKVHTFDFDSEGKMRMISVKKKGETLKTSGDGDWALTELKIEKEELNTSLDVQLIKTSAVANNNVVVYITNQYGETMPFFTIPIGGIPKYKYKIGVKPK